MIDSARLTAAVADVVETMRELARRQGARDEASKRYEEAGVLRDRAEEAVLTSAPPTGHRVFHVEHRRGIRPPSAPATAAGLK